MDLNRVLKKCRIRHIFIVLVCKRYYNWKRGDMYGPRISSTGGVRFVDDTDE